MADINIPAVPVHPGEILEEEFLRPLGLSQTDLAKHIGVSVRRCQRDMPGPPRHHARDRLAARVRVRNQSEILAEWPSYL